MTQAPLPPAPGRRDGLAEACHRHHVHAPRQPRQRGGSGGAFVRSGFRQVRSSIYVPGGSFDNTQVFESWVQFGGQY